MANVVYYLASFLAVIIVVSLHEFSHAFVAYKFGDPTAKFSGRMTLNPLKHFDPLGIVAFVLVGFGWAKPVPVNPNNFRRYKQGCFWTSAAGIIINYISAFLFYPLFLLVCKYAGRETYAFDLFYWFTYFLFAYSLSFCVFNLLPFYPLDGFRIVDALNRKRGKVYRFLRQYGYYILLVLMLVHFLAEYVSFLAYVDILGYVMSFAIHILGWPIEKLWLLIFR